MKIQVERGVEGVEGVEAENIAGGCTAVGEALVLSNDGDF